MSSVSNGLYFLTLPLVSDMRVIYRKIRHARYLYIKRNVKKVWDARYTLGARYLSKNTVDATYYFIVLLIGSTCFGHYYAHHQEIATVMLITTFVVSFLVCCRLEVGCG